MVNYDQLNTLERSRSDHYPKKALKKVNKNLQTMLDLMPVDSELCE